MKLKEIIKKVKSGELESWEGWTEFDSCPYYFRISKDLEISYERPWYFPIHGEFALVTESSSLTYKESLNLIVKENPQEILWTLLRGGHILRYGMDLFNTKFTLEERLKFIGTSRVNRVGTIIYPNGEKFTGLIRDILLRKNLIYFIINGGSDIVGKEFTKECKLIVKGLYSEFIDLLVPRFWIDLKSTKVNVPESPLYKSLEGGYKKLSRSTVGKLIKFYYESNNEYTKVIGTIDSYIRKIGSSSPRIMIDGKKYYSTSMNLITELPS